eukprot:TRINITY_DN14075_c1_g2_i1.p1 TRINITY_DN14075_c1_g2~~TRINITY_DN14075_c1_g2_i1.p1  ORF type:complete len:468 (+),score=85.25 TRINITY_DN14075_c1_g2_i1:3-1406(+)
MICFFLVGPYADAQAAMPPAGNPALIAMLEAVVLLLTAVQQVEGRCPLGAAVRTLTPSESAAAAARFPDETTTTRLPEHAAAGAFAGRVVFVDPAGQFLDVVAKREGTRRFSAAALMSESDGRLCGFPERLKLLRSDLEQCADALCSGGSDVDASVPFESESDARSCDGCELGHRAATLGIPAGQVQPCGLESRILSCAARELQVLSAIDVCSHNGGGSTYSLASGLAARLRDADNFGAPAPKPKAKAKAKATLTPRLLAAVEADGELLRASARSLHSLFGQYALATTENTKVDYAVSGASAAAGTAFLQGSGPRQLSGILLQAMLGDDGPNDERLLSLCDVVRRHGRAFLHIGCDVTGNRALTALWPLIEERCAPCFVALPNANLPLHLGWIRDRLVHGRGWAELLSFWRLPSEPSRDPFEGPRLFTLVADPRCLHGENLWRRPLGVAMHGSLAAVARWWNATSYT